jgi:hypothetical protein
LVVAHVQSCITNAITAARECPYSSILRTGADLASIRVARFPKSLRPNAGGGVASQYALGNINTFEIQIKGKVVAIVPGFASLDADCAALGNASCVSGSTLALADLEDRIQRILGWVTAILSAVASPNAGCFFVCVVVPVRAGIDTLLGFSLGDFQPWISAIFGIRGGLPKNIEVIQEKVEFGTTSTAQLGVDFGGCARCHETLTDISVHVVGGATFFKPAKQED